MVAFSLFGYDIHPSHSIRHLHMDLRRLARASLSKAIQENGPLPVSASASTANIFITANLRTVGNDSTFYRPPTANQLKNYLNQIPEDFQMCFKVWEELTIPTFSSHPRYGTKAGQPNARFLDASLFKDQVLAPYREANFSPHTGPFSLSFSATVCLPRTL